MLRFSLEMDQNAEIKAGRWTKGNILLDWKVKSGITKQNKFKYKSKSMQEARATEDKQGKINRHYNKGQGEN